MVEAREQVVESEDLEKDQESVKPDLKLLSQEDDLSSSVEFAKELDILSKFEQDFGLAEDGRALDVLAEHSDVQENAARYVEACLANEIYFSAKDQIGDQSIENPKPLHLIDTRGFTSGNLSAVLEAQAPHAPQLKSAYDHESADPNGLRQVIRAGYANFFKKVTGSDYEALAAKSNDLIKFIRDIQPAYSPGETAEISRKRALLEKKLNDFANPRKFLATKYEGILLPIPSTFNSEVVFDLTGEIDRISAAEYLQGIAAITDEANALKEESDAIRPAKHETQTSKDSHSPKAQKHQEPELSFGQFMAEPIKQLWKEFATFFGRNRK